MANFLISEPSQIFMPILAGLSILVVISPRPTLSAIFLFFQSVLFSAYLIIARENNSPYLGSSIFLDFLSSIMVAGTLYFEISTTTNKERASKFKLMVGALLIVFAWRAARLCSFLPSDIEHGAILDRNFIVVGGFSLFVILAAALITFDGKTFKSRAP